MAARRRRSTHPGVYLHRANTAADAVFLWRPEEEGLVASSSYAPNSLQLTITTGEDRQRHWTFKDKHDRTVLELAAGENGEKLPTHYVYDLKGNLTDVVPPKTAAAIASGRPRPSPPATSRRAATAISTTAAIAWSRKPCPAPPEFMVYDRWDRLVLSQDGVQRAAGRWSFNKYDAFDRVVMSGEIVLPGDRSEVQQRAGFLRFSRSALQFAMKCRATFMATPTAAFRCCWPPPPKSTS